MRVDIYSLIGRERLHDVLCTLHAFTGLPVQILDNEGGVLKRFGRISKYCELIHKSAIPSEECSKLYIEAGKRAQAFGGAYIYACHANLNHIAFPLQHEGILLACITIGPFLMDAPDSTLVSSIAKKYALTPTTSLELYDELTELQIVAPSRVNQLSRLINHLLSPLLSSEMSLLQSREALYQQSRINESIQMYKEQSPNTAPRLLYSKESELMAKVRAGNVQEAKALLNELLGYVLFTEGGQLDSIRTRAIELTTLLSRVAIDGGAKAESMYDLNRQFLLLMDNTQTIDGLCAQLQNVVESFMDAMFTAQDKGNIHIREALRIMSERYSEPLPLAEVANAIGLSPNYLSMLFKKIVGVSFREQLNRIRVEESKYLLLYTNYPLAEIAIAMGFTDQSYFNHIFKRLVGISPGQFRNLGKRKLEDQ